jgi:hypothetical protein
MKKVCLGILVGALVSACASIDVSNTSMAIERGMTQQQVMQLISDPNIAKERTFRGSGTAIQFCSGLGGGSRQSNGVPVDYVIVWFVDNHVEGLTQYRAYADNYFESCSKGFREVDWGQAPADVRVKLNID